MNAEAEELLRSLEVITAKNMKQLVLMNWTKPDPQTLTACRQPESLCQLAMPGVEEVVRQASTIFDFKVIRDIALRSTTSRIPLMGAGYGCQLQLWSCLCCRHGLRNRIRILRDATFRCTLSNGTALGRSVTSAPA